MSSPSLSDHSLPPSPIPEAKPDQPLGDLDELSATPAEDPGADMDDLSDNDSILSDVDEAQFEDFDPNQIAIEERPAIAVDEDNVKLLGRHKRKRTEGEVDGEKTKKNKGAKREKPKKVRKKKDSDDDDFSGGQELEGKRVRKKKAFTEGGEKVRKEKTKPRQAEPEDEEQLDPEERRRRALDRAMDAALKNPTKRRRRAGEVDLNAMADEEIADLRLRMAEAADLDQQARQSKPPKPAMHKLRLLPEVTALLNRNSRDVESAIVDAENNLLESVRFFLEPLPDGQLPAYNIQRELFASLTRLPIDKEALISSGIGKVVLFYTKSKKPELAIKRAAERLLGEWTRPILKRSDDYRKRALPSADYDPLTKVRSSQVPQSQAELAQAAREKALAPLKSSNRARVETDRKTYTIVPRSGQVAGGMFARPLGASGDDAFRRMKARQAAAQGKGPRRG
ncbi:hypothetical protein OEA41_009291 [Lepraria neglecta]|uniref:TFIIS N-terminal domain-containing protein n=1 Tax=Lepraria neglecta TaxID=209136 RepID=A0AAD9Z408_9LECA|nr:hypothetical protein OEA41_009291 [Lepraria neglecta]